jgi:hypothetical protein
MYSPGKEIRLGIDTTDLPFRTYVYPLNQPATAMGPLCNFAASGCGT